MAKITIDDAILYTEDTKHHFTQKDRRYKAAARHLLTLLQIPLPPWAYAAVSGPKSAENILKDFAADNRFKSTKP